MTWLAICPALARMGQRLWPAHGYRGIGFVKIAKTCTKGRDFLAERISDMQEEGIRHLVTSAIVQDDEGAFRAKVVGVGEKCLRFFGWVEFADGKISRYIIGPEP